MTELYSSIDEREFALFSDYIAEKSGIFIRPEKAYLIETRLSKLMTDVGAESFSKFYDYIVSNPHSGISQKIINAITVNETTWFRDTAVWTILMDEVIPAFVKELLSGKKQKIRIWSAASSTGEEAYSLAMCIDDYLGKNNIKGVGLPDFEIIATDISERVLDIARKGRYDRVSMSRGMNDYYKNKYFENTGSAWNLVPEILEAVKFEQFNLINSFAGLGKFDLILCRYVLIYFPDELKKRIIQKLHDSLKDNGVLFTGTYVLYDLFKDGFEMVNFENITYYTRKQVDR